MNVWVWLFLIFLVVPTFCLACLSPDQKRELIYRMERFQSWLDEKLEELEKETESLKNKKS